MVLRRYPQIPNLRFIYAHGLNQDICNLSTLCSQSRQHKHKQHQQSGNEDFDNFNRNEPATKTISPAELLESLHRWLESGHLPEPEIVAHIEAACNEISNIRGMPTKMPPSSQGNLFYQFPMLWQKKALKETKRQYEAIDRALEVLNNLKTLVQEHPALAELQHDLEEANFKSAGIVPIYTSLVAGLPVEQDIEEDVNANESPTLSSNGNQTQINSPA